MENRNTDGLRDIALWRTFLAAHRAGSVSAAARMLGLAQSSVTAHLQTLEQVVGEPLFVRHARGIRPTARADRFAAGLGEHFDALGRALGAHEADLPATIRIGGAAEFLARVAIPALAPAIADGLRVEATSGLAEDLLDLLRAGSLDLVVAAVRPRGRSLPAAAFVDEEFVLVAAPSAGIRPSSGLAPHALDEVPLLAYARDVPILRRYWRHVFGVRLEREPALIAPDLRALAAAAVAGAGATVLPSYLIADELADGRLVILRETDDPPINTLYLVRRPGPLGAEVAAVDRALRSAV